MSLINYQSAISPSYLISTEDECMGLYEDSVNDALWEAYYHVLNPGKNIDNRELDIRAIVISDLEKHYLYVEKTIELIVSSRIANIICPSVAFDTLKTMPRLDRTFYVLSSLRNSHTQLFIDVLQHLKQQETSYRDYELSTDLMHHLLNGRHGSYDDGDVVLCLTEMHYTQGLFCLNPL